MLEILEANTLKGGEYHPGYRPMPPIAPEFRKYCLFVVEFPF